MEYFQNDLLSYYSQHAGHKINKITFQYATEKQEDKAALNFHLTQREKKNIMSSPDFLFNKVSFDKVVNLFNKKDSIGVKPVE
jgi:isocitrate/isopropylmalate dehydrogenase